MSCVSQDVGNKFLNVIKSLCLQRFKFSWKH